MIRVVHYDHNRFFSNNLRESLVQNLSEYPNVNYLDYNPGSDIFETIRGDLEKLLPEKDVLLIHPGVKGQEVISSYPIKFPHLKIAYVIVGEFEAYQELNGIRLFLGCRDIKRIVNFILEPKK